MNPLVSVGMPLYNAEKTLELTVRSILKQTYSNWKLILIDDGSTDGTVALARSFKDPRINLIEGGVNKGLPSRLNDAVSAASGSYFARMDQDDIAYPDRLETQVKFLMDHDDIDLIGAWMIIFRDDGMVLGKRAPSGCSHEEICSRPQGGFYLGHPTWMGKLDWFRDHPYRPEAIMTEDQDLLLRTYETSRFACVPRVLLGYREEKLSLKKILRSRRGFLLSVLRHARMSGRPIPLVEIAKQALKACVDIAAIGSGFGYKLLRHRVGSVDRDEIEKWNEVWKLTTS